MRAIRCDAMRYKDLRGDAIDAMRCDALKCEEMQRDRCDTLKCEAMMRCEQTMRCDVLRCDALRCEAMRAMRAMCVETTFDDVRRDTLKNVIDANNANGRVNRELVKSVRVARIVLRR